VRSASALIVQGSSRAIAAIAPWRATLFLGFYARLTAGLNSRDKA
jgi:hypothetical protein